MKNIISVLLLSLTVVACSGTGSNYSPVVDYSGSPASTQGRNYNEDLNACRGIATQESPVRSAATQGAIGALVGAAGGAAIGAILGRPGTGAAIGAAGGAIGGTARGGLTGTERQEQIVRDCMRGRGWNAF